MMKLKEINKKNCKIKRISSHSAVICSPGRWTGNNIFLMVASEPRGVFWLEYCLLVISPYSPNAPDLLLPPPPHPLPLVEPSLIGAGRGLSVGRSGEGSSTVRAAREQLSQRPASTRGPPVSLKPLRPV